MRYLDVCSGYSAPTVAWQGLGFECAGYSEIESFPRAVLEQRHGAVPVDFDHYHIPGENMIPLFGDFTQIKDFNVGPVQLLVGGTPCQSFSVAGKRLGLDDPRGNLTLEWLALVERLRPRWVLWENVPGVLSDDKGRTLGSFLGILGKLGYGWAYRVLDAQYVRVGMFGRAVPQRRRRVFVVGYLGNPSRAAAVLFDRSSLRGDPAPRREAGQVAAGTVTASAARRRGNGQLDSGNIIAADVAGTIPSGGNKTGGTRPPGTSQETADTMLVAHTDVSHPVLRKWAKGTGGPSGDECQNLVAFDTTQITNPSNASNPKPGQPCHTMASGAHPPAIAFSNSIDYAVRRLTPLECERLQGLPDDFTAITYRGKIASDSARYKAIGNSMAVNVMRWIGERIAFVDNLKDA